MDVQKEIRLYGIKTTSKEYIKKYNAYKAHSKACYRRKEKTPENMLSFFNDKGVLIDGTIDGSTVDIVATEEGILWIYIIDLESLPKGTKAIRIEEERK